MDSFLQIEEILNFPCALHTYYIPFGFTPNGKDSLEQLNSVLCMLKFKFLCSWKSVYLNYEDGKVAGF